MFFFFFFNIYLFGLCQVLVAACWIFYFPCIMLYLQLQLVGSSSLTWAPCIGSSESQPLPHQEVPVKMFFTCADGSFHLSWPGLCQHRRFYKQQGLTVQHRELYSVSCDREFPSGPVVRRLGPFTKVALARFSSWSVQFSSVTQLCLTLCDPRDCSTPGFPVCFTTS